MPGQADLIDIENLYRENIRFLKAQQWPRRPAGHDYNDLARRAEREIARRARVRGYRVYPTKANSPFDLWVEGVKVEVKASRWYDSASGGRYQAHVRNHRADLLILDCINGTDHFFVIPMAQIFPRKCLTVWSYDPSQSAGQWVEYLEAWPVLETAIERASANWQPPLFQF